MFYLTSHSTQFIYGYMASGIIMVKDHSAREETTELQPDYLRGKSVRLWCDGLSDRSFIVDPLSYFSFQPVLHDWCTVLACVVLSVG